MDIEKTIEEYQIKLKNQKDEYEAKLKAERKYWGRTILILIGICFIILFAATNNKYNTPEYSGVTHNELP